MRRILIIQTAFLGDVVLATPLIEKLGRHFPHAELDFLLRKGNEGLVHQHPRLHDVLIWDKKQGKYRDLLRLLRHIRRRRYDLVVNCQRFASSGVLTAFSKAGHTVGFDKNPLSRLFSKKLPHRIGEGHEVQRNLQLIQHLTDGDFQMPRLYPSAKDKASAPAGDYVCMAPASVWFTKQLPSEKWVELCQRIPVGTAIHLLGAPGDYPLCQHIADTCVRNNIHNQAGRLSLLQSAAWMAAARMNYVNDSAPLHLASAMDAPCAAFFCSTVPSFGFGPLSGNGRVLEHKGALPCRPCGLHGKRACPEGHFKCGDIDLDGLPLHS